jgi:TolB-like protein
VHDRVPNDLAQSSKLSIAVLPFPNLSGNSALRYFNDGITVVVLPGFVVPAPL